MARKPTFFYQQKPMSTTAALERIERWARGNDPAFVALLQPGLTRQAIDVAVSGLPFVLAEEVYELYQWHNGQREGKFQLGLHQWPTYPFMPLSEALDEYTRSQAFNFELEVKNEYCDFAESGGWLPIFGEQMEYTATIGQAPGTLTSPLAWVSREDKTTLHYPSLTAMLEFRADLYDADAMRQDADGEQWVEYAIASVIQQQHFPEQAAEAERNYAQFGKPSSLHDAGHYSTFEAQRADAVSRLISAGSEQALSVVAEYLQEQISDQALAASVLHDLQTRPNKVYKEWPWTRHIHIGGLAVHFQID